MSGSYEIEKAIMEAERNAATDAYFKARPKKLTPLKIGESLKLALKEHGILGKRRRCTTQS